MWFHEQLRVYGQLLQMVRVLRTEWGRWPRGLHGVREQLQRALASAVLTLAEGNQKPTSADRRRFYAMTRGSLAESAAALDLVSAFGASPAGVIAPLKTTLLGICKQVARLG